MTTAVGTSVGPRLAGVAAERGEHTLATVVAISRAAALVLLVAALAPGPWSGPRAVPLAVLAAVAGLESAALIASCLVTRRVSRAWAALDVLCLTGLIGLSATPAVLPGGPEQSPLYNFSVVAVIAFGLPAWPLGVTLVTTGAVALANVASAASPGSSYPLWNALPDSATYLGVGLIAWVLAWLLRTSARSLDRHREAAVTRAATLAGQRERARQQHDLGAQLLSTVEELASGEAITDPRLLEQVRHEADWLREVVSSGLPEPPGALFPALRDVVAEKTVAGLRIDMGLPEAEPRLAAATVGAVAQAVREALTNVTKHARTTRATVAVRPADGGLTIEVADAGRGYDPASTLSRVGQRRSIRERIEEVGGRVEIESLPGSGTRVRLWVPAESEGGRG